MEFVENECYCIEKVEPSPFYDTFYPLKNVKYIKSYGTGKNKSLVFEHEVQNDDYIEWLQCWVNIASNHMKINYDSKDLIETHIYEYKIVAFTKIA
jgi:hypothetical protein